MSRISGIFITLCLTGIICMPHAASAYVVKAELVCKQYGQTVKDYGTSETSLTINGKTVGTRVEKNCTRGEIGISVDTRHNPPYILQDGVLVNDPDYIYQYFSKVQYCTCNSGYYRYVANIADLVDGCTCHQCPQSGTTLSEGLDPDAEGNGCGNTGINCKTGYYLAHVTDLDYFSTSGQYLGKYTGDTCLKNGDGAENIYSYTGQAWRCAQNYYMNGNGQCVVCPYCMERKYNNTPWGDNPFVNTKHECIFGDTRTCTDNIGVYRTTNNSDYLICD